MNNLKAFAVILILMIPFVLLPSCDDEKIATEKNCDVIITLTNNTLEKIDDLDIKLSYVGDEDDYNLEIINLYIKTEIISILMDFDNNVTHTGKFTHKVASMLVSEYMLKMGIKNYTLKVINN